MHLLLFKLSAALFILATSLIVGWKPLFLSRSQPNHRMLEFGEAFGGGIFLGIGLFHMLPEAQENFQAVYGHLNYPFANLLCALGFISLLFLEKILLHAPKTAGNAPMSTSISYILPVILSVHALIEGTALGINITFVNTLFIFIAIIAHKGSESFALATNIGRSTIPRKWMLPIFTLWAFMSPLGVVMGSIAALNLHNQTGQIAAAVFNAFAAGTFLYIATLHKTSHICSENDGNHLHEFMLMLLGLTIMAVVEIWL